MRIKYVIIEFALAHKWQCSQQRCTCAQVQKYLLSNKLWCEVKMWGQHVLLIIAGLVARWGVVYHTGGVR